MDLAWIRMRSPFAAHHTVDASLAVGEDSSREGRSTGLSERFHGAGSRLCAHKKVPPRMVVFADVAAWNRRANLVNTRLYGPMRTSGITEFVLLPFIL